MTSPRLQRTRLCLCADDFGQHRGVNDAVAQLADIDRLHAVGVLVGAPASKVGAPTLRRLAAQGLDVGLHLDLTEFPLLPGMRQPLGRLIFWAMLHQLDRQRLHAEIRAQLDVFEAVLGHAPAFVDGHQHVHQLPGVRDMLLAELGARYATALPWLRCTSAAAVPGLGASARFKGLTIEWLGGHGLRAEARRQGFAQNRRLLGVYDFQGGSSRYKALLRQWLAAAGDGDVLMCHPGLPHTGADPLGIARTAEFQVLANACVTDMLREQHVVLQPMRQILASAV